MLAAVYRANCANRQFIQKTLYSTRIGANNYSVIVNQNQYDIPFNTVAVVEVAQAEPFSVISKSTTKLAGNQIILELPGTQQANRVSLIAITQTNMFGLQSVAELTLTGTWNVVTQI